MEVVIKIIMIIVIITTQKTDKMIDWKRKKLWFEQETGQLHTLKQNILLKVTSATRKTI